MTARILVIDIETQRAVLESFSLYVNYIHQDRVIVAPRILCWAAKWRGEDQMIFKAAWDDDDVEGYRKMIKSAFDLFSAADFVVTFNGDRFDVQWLEAEFGRLGMGRPAPYRSIDLRKIQKRYFGKGLMSLSLQWSARHWLNDSKTPHSASDIWHDVRYGNREERRAARRLFKIYNEKDTALTERLFEAYLPWIGENFALFEDGADDGTPRCNKCNSENVQRRGTFPTKTCMYPRWRCNECGSWSRGRRMIFTNELRPV